MEKLKHKISKADIIYRLQVYQDKLLDCIIQISVRKNTANIFMSLLCNECLFIGMDSESSCFIHC